jgi:hypothetical protein
MAASSLTTGWMRDHVNNRLDFYFLGTRIGHINASGLTSALGLTSSSATSGIGYATGAGSTVTQASNRATGVTINAITGAITTVTTSLAAEASAVFVVTNSAVAIGDVVILSMRSGSVALNTQVEVTAVAAGSFSISVINNNVASGTAETGAIIINFAVIKAVSA